MPPNVALEEDEEKKEFDTFLPCRKDAQIRFGRKYSKRNDGDI